MKQSEAIIYRVVVSWSFIILFARLPLKQDFRGSRLLLISKLNTICMYVKPFLYIADLEMMFVQVGGGGGGGGGAWIYFEKITNHLA